MEGSENIEETLIGEPYSSLVFSPNNKYLIGSAGSTCELIVEKKPDFRRRLKHDSDVVAAFFQTNERLVTVTVSGEVTEFEANEQKFEKIVSRRVTAFPVVAAFLQPSKSEEDKELVVWLVVEKSEWKKEKEEASTYDVCVTGANGSLDKVLEIPAGVRREQIAIADGVVSYCRGLEVHSIILNDDDRSVVKRTKHVTKNGGGEGECLFYLSLFW
ncbi:unnamed protein product [Caenorhabditis sp. 36 PRJEB53466]|nr:unnamed protein product [Caenorhabditis sp. 36 PRJEB53466]